MTTMTIPATEIPLDPDITDPQARILKFFIEFRADHSPPKSPSYEEVEDAMHISRSTINMHLNRLRGHRMMTDTTNSKRGWRPTKLGERYYHDNGGDKWEF